MLNKLDVYHDLEEMQRYLQDVHHLFGDRNQICVTSRAGEEGALQEGIGWLPEGVTDDDYHVINEPFLGSPIEQILLKLPFRFGRSRLIRLPERSCLTIHWDDCHRYHYAIQTNPAAYIMFFADTENVTTARIPADGYIYDMDATRTHTAINAGKEERIHLVISGPVDGSIKAGRPLELYPDHQV